VKFSISKAQGLLLILAVAQRGQSRPQLTCSTSEHMTQFSLSRHVSFARNFAPVWAQHLNRDEEITSCFVYKKTTEI
jgi:hypothetical protein